MTMTTIGRHTAPAKVKASQLGRERTWSSDAAGHAARVAYYERCVANGIGLFDGERVSADEDDDLASSRRANQMTHGRPQ
jgi:hypothetical protein